MSLELVIRSPFSAPTHARISVTQVNADGPIVNFCRDSNVARKARPGFWIAAVVVHLTYLPHFGIQRPLPQPARPCSIGPPNRTNK